MTDTIDVAALVERLRDFQHTPHEGDPMVDMLLDMTAEAATALQSQADALAEARRQWRNYEAAAGEQFAARSTAEASLATMREALEKAEHAARNLMPYLEWQLSAESPGHHPTFGSAVAFFKGSFAPEVFAPGSSRFDDWHARRALGGSNAE